MGDQKQLVQQYEQKQKALKKENKIYIRRIPYYLFGLIFCALGLITLLDGKLNNYVGNSYNLILVVATVFAFISIIYLVIILKNLRRNKKEIKALGNKVYKIMKL